MPKYTSAIARSAITVLFIAAFAPAYATHLIGNEFSYVYLGMLGSSYHYRVTLTIYQDCLDGDPYAITLDNPAYLSVFNGTTLLQRDSIPYSSSAPVIATTSGPCGTGVPTLPVCILKKTFNKDYFLAASSTGYTIVYQRCCKNGALTNVIDPLNVGSTYICTIPPTGTVANNNSAVFTNYPPTVIGVNTPFLFDCSATDTDGDSLTYELCAGYDGASSASSKPWAIAPPPYSDVSYTTPLSYSNPMSCSVPLTIDATTGIMSATPNITGRYLIAVACKEWRGGVLINTNRREFELAVQTLPTSSYTFSAAPDTVIYTGDTVHFRTAYSTSYLWSPGTYLNSTTTSNPTGFFPDPGVFHYVVRGVSDSGCTGYDTLTVTVVRESEMAVPNAFSPNNDGHNDLLAPIPVKSCTLVSFKVYNRTGQQLFATNNPNIGWDGTFQGKKQDLGVYYWELFYQDNNGRLHSKTGSTTLIR